MAKKQNNAEGRREFLKLAGLGTVLGGAALATSGTASATEAVDEAASGYRETAHVKTYYDLARF